MILINIQISVWLIKLLKQSGSHAYTHAHTTQCLVIIITTALHNCISGQKPEGCQCVSPLTSVCWWTGSSLAYWSALMGLPGLQNRVE